MLRRRSLLLTVLVLALTPATQAWAGTGDEIIVRRAPGLDAAERGALRRDADVEHVRDLGFGQVEVVEAAVGDRADALADLARDPDVLWAEPNSVVRATAAAPDDMHFGLQWALRNTGQSVGGVAGTAGADVGALQAWDRSTGAGVLVAVVDTGAQLAHPDLQLSGPGAERAAGNATNGIDDDGDGIVDDAAGYDWVDDDVTPEDLNGHGTHVAGIIAAAAGNRQGISGVVVGPRELVRVVWESVIGGCRFERRRLGLGSPRSCAVVGGCSRLSSRRSRLGLGVGTRTS